MMTVFHRLSLHEVDLFITWESPSNCKFLQFEPNKKGVSILSLYGGQSLRYSARLLFGIKRVNLICVWYY